MAGPIIDMYSGLSHKLGMDPDASGGVDAAPAYLSDPDKRRINAYARLRAMLETVARYYLDDTDDDGEDRKNAWREFGDPAVLVATQAAAVLGDNPLLTVDPLPDRPLPSIRIYAPSSEPVATGPNSPRWTVFVLFRPLQPIHGHAYSFR